MYSHRAVAMIKGLGKVVLYFDYPKAKLPIKGVYKAYCADIASIVEFDFQFVVESRIIDKDLV